MKFFQVLLDPKFWCGVACYWLMQALVKNIKIFGVVFINMIHHFPLRVWAQNLDGTTESVSFEIYASLVQITAVEVKEINLSVGLRSTPWSFAKSFSTTQWDRDQLDLNGPL